MFAYGQSDTVSINATLQKSLDLQRTDPDSSFVLAEKALVWSEQAKFNSGIRKACLRLGSVWMTRGENQKAKSHINRALQIDLKANHTKNLAVDYHLMAYVHEGNGHQDSGFAALYKALRYAETEKDPELLAHIYSSLGVFNHDYDRFELSIQNFLEAERLALKAKNADQLISIYMGLGNVKYSQDSFSEALHFYKRVDSLSLATGDEISRLQNLNNMALCLAETRQFPAAIELYREALNGYTANSMLLEEANIYYNLGELFSKLNEIDSSLYYYKRSINLNRKINYLPSVANAYQAISDLYARKDDFMMAYTFHLRYSALSDSLLNSEKISSISEMKTRFETEKKEQEILSLSLKNAIKNRQNNLFLGGTILLLGFSLVLFIQRNRIKKERNKSDKLLLNILPGEVAEELKHSGNSAARLYPRVSVLFTDFINFTGISATLTPEELVAEIHRNFTAFDQITENHGLEKIKTIGDAYLAVCGLPHETSDHAERVVRAAQEIIEFLAQGGSRFEIRIGIHSGPVVAGIVGIKKYAYDIWGDTVNTAARMEQNSEAGKINISGATYALIQNTIPCTYRGMVAAKNKGEIDMYFVD